MLDKNQTQLAHLQSEAGTWLANLFVVAPTHPPVKWGLTPVEVFYQEVYYEEQKARHDMQSRNEKW